MDRQQRPEWQKPALTVVLRHRPEEAVMTNCKDVAQSGFNSQDAACRYISGGCSNCYTQFPS
jgi:hypothetical protein